MMASNARGTQRNTPSRESFGILALLSLLIAAPTALIIRLLEPELVLPALSILLFTDAAIAAIVARRSPQNIMLWDIAGAFTMMGCAAAIFAEPDQVALLLEPSIESHPDAPSQED
jgi:hypothetical protein